MKKNRNVASIFVIVGGLLMIMGIVINNFMPEKEKEYKSHVEEKTLCEQTLYEEKTKIVATKYDSETEEYEYKLITEQLDFDQYISDYEYEFEDIYFDFNNYDYLIYYINDGNLCNRSKTLTNYSINNNVINIEFIKNELNKETCKYNTSYAYVLEIKKYQLDENLTVKTNIKEDPYKECYTK